MTRREPVLKRFATSLGLRKILDNQYERDDFVRGQLRGLASGSKILDAGCGNQRYRNDCAHLRYFAQDFGGYDRDLKMGFHDGVGGVEGYQYGPLDYVGNIWDIQEADGVFDAILCTEVFEHIPYPIATLKEFSRLLRPGGTLILTAPSNCLRHMDPFFFYTGFSDRFYERILPEYGFHLKEIQPVGDYYKWLAVELARTALYHSWLSKLLLLPAFFYFLSKKPTEQSINLLCMGYHLVAVKRESNTG